MSSTPPHILERRARRRRQLRRRRAVALASLVGLIGLTAVVVVGLGGGSHTTGSRPSIGATSSVVASAPAVSVAQDTPLDPNDPDVVNAPTLQSLLASGLPVYCGGDHGREIALTFDDGPGVYTHYALKKLRQAHDVATFFDVGNSINNFPGYLPREHSLGALGDHTYTHVAMISLPGDEVSSELSRTAALIHAQSGQPVQLWRPPYELYNSSVLGIARGLGLLTILWSLDSQDSLGANYQQIIDNVMDGVRPGAIIELHENHGQTIRALTTLLPELHAHHWKTVTIPELLNTDPPTVAQLQQGLRGCGPLRHTALPAAA